MSILTAKNLTHYFQDGESVRYILNDVNLEFEKGKVYGILGYSGSGKTTLISLLSGLDSPKSGEVLFNGENIEKVGLSTYRRNDIAIVFQQYNLISYLTARENIEVAMGITDNNLPADKKEIAYNLLDYVGIVRTKADRPVPKLSGGEQQRVAIARALSTNVDLIFADEPTGNLDSETEIEIIGLFKKLAHEHNKCIILVTHANEVAAHADVVLRLNKGTIEVEEKREN